MKKDTKEERAFGSTGQNRKQNLNAGEIGITLRVWQESWDYITAIVDTVREPFLILDEKLRVLVANESFCRTFQVAPKDTEGKPVYALGNGQWNIPALRKLLEEILPQNTFFKGFEVSHEFPLIGRRVMILNARRIDTDKDSVGVFPPIILLAMEDVTEIMFIADTLAGHANRHEVRITERTHELEARIGKLQKEVNKLKVRRL